MLSLLPRLEVGAIAASHLCGRALRAGFDDLETIGLALLYPALAWSSITPGHQHWASTARRNDAAPTDHTVIRCVVVHLADERSTNRSVMQRDPSYGLCLLRYAWLCRTGAILRRAARRWTFGTCGCAYQEVGFCSGACRSWPWYFWLSRFMSFDSTSMKLGAIKPASRSPARNLNR
jgi:hypothetical protein